MTTSKTDGASIEQFNQRFRERLKKSGFRVLGGSMFDEGESAKVVLNAVKKGKPSDDQQV